MPLTPEEQQELAALEASVEIPAATSFEPNIVENPTNVMQQPQTALTPEEQQELQMLEADVGQSVPTAREEQFGTPKEIAKTALEGIAEGIVGPLAPLVEKHLLKVKPSEMRARREENPGTFAAGQVAGLGLGMFTGAGEGALLTKAGAGAAELANIGKAGSFIRKVSAEAIDQAAQSAILQGSDEISKMIIKDPESSAENAISNVGLATALGGLTGAGIGSISPLWKATVGPKFEEFLGGVKKHIDGGGLALPEEIDTALTTLGVQVDDVTKAGLSKDPRTTEMYGVLRETDNPAVKQGLDKLVTDVEQSVSQKLGIDTADIANYSENEAGHDLLDTFKKEYDAKYQPIAEKLQKRNAEAATISLSDDARLDQYGKMLEDAMTKVGTDSPQYKLYDEWGNRMLAKDTVGGLDMLKTEISNDIKAAERVADYNRVNALKDIRRSLSDFQENQILRQAEVLDTTNTYQGGKTPKSFIPGEGTAMAKDLIAERAMTNKQYADFANISNDLMDHLGVGNFSGAKGLTNKLTDKVSAEQLLNKFSIKGNADFIPFLKQHFPEVYTKVQQNELKKFLKPAYFAAKGEAPFNIKKLGDLVEKGLAGQKEYVEALLTPDALQAIEAGKKVLGGIPDHKSSKTASWLGKITKGMPASGLAMVSMLAGNNPFLSAMMGASTEYIGREVPDAMRLAYMKFLGSGQPIKSESFKAMVDYMQNTYKAQKAFETATKAVFQPGMKVAIKELSKDDTQKLDKVVDKYTDNPEALGNVDNGQLGHYMGDHQTALTAASIKAASYLSSIKPRPYRSGPLDAEIKPTDAQMQRYNRALGIAQQPMVILQRVKDGVLQSSDVQDLMHMYPALHKQMVTGLTNQLMTAKSKGVNIPYKTKMSISLLMGQALDSSMSPTSIQAAQATSKSAQTKNQQQMPPQQSTPTKGAASKLGKNIPSYMTPEQSRAASKSKDQ